MNLDSVAVSRLDEFVFCYYINELGQLTLNLHYNLLETLITRWDTKMTQ